MGDAGFASIVVVNYNGRHFLVDCLTALERQTVPRHRYEVLLIDNGSSDGSVDFVREYFAGVRVYSLRDNLGFTGANNLGFRRARGRYVVLLNNDTRVEEKWLEGLLDAVTPRPEALRGERFPQALPSQARVATSRGVGGVASKLLFRDEPHLVNSTGLVLYRDGRGGDRHLRRPDGTVADEPAEVFGGCGASLLLTHELLDDLGGFDPKLFMYYEDLDLCWRARLRGWRFVYTPESVVHHVCGGSSEMTSPFRLRQIERNRVLVSLRNAPPLLALSAIPGVLLRNGRLWLRYLRSRRAAGCIPAVRLTHIGAISMAVLSVLAWLPATLYERYRTRIESRRISDSGITPFMARHS
jgi:GT2 family glycosyltransferase